MNMQVVILAGGLGTRLRPVVNDRPKPMAEINGRPFLEYVIKNFTESGFTRFLILVGYKGDQITSYFGDGSAMGATITYSIESGPLGTGGALKNAWQKLDDRFMFANGDTMFAINYEKFLASHLERRSDLTIACRWISNNTRYGNIVTNTDGKILSFANTQNPENTLINGGCYAIEKSCLNFSAIPQAFSFEKDYLPPLVKRRNCHAFVDSGYFMDIGIPEDLAKFRAEQL